MLITQELKLDLTNLLIKLKTYKILFNQPNIRLWQENKLLELQVEELLLNLFINILLEKKKFIMFIDLLLKNNLLLEKLKFQLQLFKRFLLLEEFKLKLELKLCQLKLLFWEEEVEELLVLLLLIHPLLL